MKHLRLLLLACCCIGLPFPSPEARAQTDTLSASYSYSRGVPGRDMIIPGIQAPSALLPGANDLGEVVRMFSGLQLKDFGGIGGLKTVNIRSLGSEYTRVYIDGIAIENAQNQTVDLGRFAPESFSAAGYYVGGQSGRLMSAKEYTAAGSLYLDSGPITGNRREIRLRGGAFGTLSPSLAISRVFRNGWKLRTEAQWTHAHGRYSFYWKDYDTTMTRENADIQALRLQARLVKDRRSLTAYYYDSERGLPGAVIRRPKGQLLSADRQTDRDFFLQGQWMGKDVHIRGKFSCQYTRYRTDPERDPSAMPMDNRYLQHNAYLSAAWHRDIQDGWQLETAADFQYDYLDANLRDFVYPHRFSGWAAIGNIFTFNHFRFSANLAWQGAADRVTDRSGGFVRENDFRHFLSPSLVASVHLGSWEADGFVRRVCRMPSFNDLYYTLVGNASLAPERALLTNLGLHRWWNLPEPFFLKTSARVFHNSVRDKIVAAPTTSSFRWSMYNIGRVEMTGADVQARFGLNGKDDRNQLAFNVSYTWQHPEEIVPYTPEHSGSFSCEWRRGGWLLCLSALANGERYTTQAAYPEYRLRPFLTADARLSYTRNGITGGISLNNLTGSDFEFVKGYPMPGRHLLASLEYRF